MKKIYIIFFTLLITGSTGTSQPPQTRSGCPLPFLEQWNTGTFETNNWTTDGPNWNVTDQEGNPAPCAEFSWDPVQSDYWINLESTSLKADSLETGRLFLDFDIKLDNFSMTGDEMLHLQLWNWENQVWTTLETFSNHEVSFDWISKHLDISDYAMGKIFRIRFAAQGENSLNILSWFIDNIHIYRYCPPPVNLNAEFVSEPESGIKLTWEQPDDGSIDDWMHWDDGFYSGNSLGNGHIFSAAARWTPDQMVDLVESSVSAVSFVPAAEVATYRIKIWKGANAATLLTDQLVESPVIGNWNVITLETPVPIDITQELWVGYSVESTDIYAGGCDDGPAVNHYGNMVYLDEWMTLLEANPELDCNWNIKVHVVRENWYDPVSYYNIYRSDDLQDYYLRDCSFADEYLDDSVCNGTLLHQYKVSAVYAIGADTCESEGSNLSSEGCTGIVEDKNEIIVKVFPNPAVDLIRLESSEIVHNFMLYDFSGNLVYSKEIHDIISEIPVKEYRAGLYMIKVETGDQLIYRKLLIVH
jgi:hypothetical protein